VSPISHWRAICGHWCSTLGLIASLTSPASWAGEAGASKVTSTFASLVEQLSESGGEFGGDNVISNEQSYLHVMPALERAGLNGGAYIGVGPDQNFSYIAQVKPAIG
jgi:hypothetical protein